MIYVRIKKLREEAILPCYANKTDAGVDLFVPSQVTVPANARGFKIDLGFAIELAADYELQIRPKSGNSMKTPLRISNAPGTIDSGFRGEIAVLIDNLSDSDFTIEKEKAIAQGVLSYVPKISFVNTDDLSESDRGVGGFGSTNRGV